MSLAVWLPLNGSLENQGFLAINGTNYNSTVSTSGKIGSCYSFNGSNCRIEYIHDKTIWNNKEISIALWYKYQEGNTTSVIVDIAADLCVSYTYSSSGLKFNYWRAYSNNGTRAGDSGSTTQYFDASQWHHVVATFNHNINKLYVDGVLADTFDRSNKYTTNFTPLLAANYNKVTIGKSAGSNPYASGLINDVRIYDHCLSPLEVKEISQGLVLHYKLDDLDNENFFNYTEIIPEDNVYTNPTFTSSSGWSHWGPSGHSGTYGQNSDKQYIFNKNNSYSHYLSEENGTGKYFLLYQVPDSPGGPRSLQCIIKEENNVPITSGVVWPSLNSRTGGAAANIWTSIKYLGDGFYYCKYENVIQSQQTGVNALFGIGVSPGYKVYISEMYLENSENCTSIFNNNTIVYDSSGYNNNGTINGTLNTSSNTSRYSISTIFNGSDNSIKIPFNDMIKDKNYTISVWTYKTSIGTKNYQTILGGPSGFELEARSSSATNPLYRIHNWGGGITPYEFNKWNLFTFVHTDSNSKLYVNGELKITGSSKDIPIGNYYIGSWNTATSQNYEGQMSDFRIYCTALSAADIQLLYSAGARADNLGGLHVQEFEEDARKGITTQRILHSSNFYESGYLELLHYDKNVYTEPDGTTWVHIFHHNDPTTNGLFASTDTFETSVYKNEHKWYDIESLMTNMPMYEFLVVQKNTSSSEIKKYRWIQNINPLEATFEDVKPGTITINTNSGYSTSSSYGGLYKMNTHARLCITKSTSSSWWGIGSWTTYNGGTVGYPEQTVTTGYIDLYIRIYTPIKFIKDTGTNALNFIEI